MRSEANLRKYVVGADDSVCPVLSRGHRSCAVGEAISFPIPCISWQVSYNGPSLTRCRGAYYAPAGLAKE